MAILMLYLYLCHIYAYGSQSVRTLSNRGSTSLFIARIYNLEVFYCRCSPALNDIHNGRTCRIVKSTLRFRMKLYLFDKIIKDVIDKLPTKTNHKSITK